MASTVLAPYTSAVVAVPASSAIAVFSAAVYQVATAAGFANYPTPLPTIVSNASGAYTSAVYTVATNVTINAGGAPLYYNVGTVPVVFERANYQPTPGTLNATGTLTAALITGGIVTSTTAAAVAATLETGAILDATSTFAVGDSFIWSVINTGGNTLTVTASTGHTIVGTATVVTVTSGRFMTLKTAASTFVTYRI